MRHARAATAAIGLGMAVALVPAEPAWACSCAGPDPATVVTLELTDADVVDAANPFGGEGPTVELRGAVISVIGDLPASLDGVDVESVPVVASVLEDPNGDDMCGTPHRPEAGSDLEVVGIVSDEGDGTFVYTGACAGGLEVLAGPGAGIEAPPGSTPPEPGPGLLVPAALGVAALLVVGLVVGGVLSPVGRRRP